MGPKEVVGIDWVQPQIEWFACQDKEAERPLSDWKAEYLKDSSEI